MKLKYKCIKCKEEISQTLIEGATLLTVCPFCYEPRLKLIKKRKEVKK